ncbi:hypothetical protein FHS27_001095 [Rhodopirellula rubra]|uniref:Uncharacterized protein n=1 Tax=Aporhodopirellula rubra TaxID=980271 RepID=A0A7W5DVR8_9BACT|nr:hypothetical protein [Aporhodopirellula rubra]MBB3205295.1 hypothetical protein [Aporhodopirellula rubra]
MKRTDIAENKFTRYARRAAVAACVLATLPSIGCRSGKPGWNMFGRRGEPSAEMLAGSGPTTTYPTPPSARATPEAIASIAGGTAPSTTNATPSTPSLPTGSNPYALAGNRMSSPESGVPGGFPTSAPSQSSNNPTPSTSLAAGNQSVPPAYALPGRTSPSSSATTPSYAAAAANGYAASTPTTPPSASSMPTGYQLGAKPASSPAATVASTPQQNSGSGFTMPPLNNLTPTRLAAGSTSSSGSTTSPSSGFTLPSSMAAPKSATVASATTSAPAASSSMALPGSSTSAPSGTSTAAPQTAVASLSLPPSSPASSSTASSGASTPISGTSTSGGSADFQTAAAASTSTSTTSSNNSVQPTGYMPGSTSKASSYPSSNPVIR